MVSNEVSNIIDIIVPCLNHLENTLECLEALKEHTKIDTYRVTVVDDGSDDDTPNVLKDNIFDFPKYKYIRHDTNSGFSTAVNAGIKSALEDNYLYIAIFNNDLVVKNNWLFPIAEALCMSPHIGMVSGTIFRKNIDVLGALENVKDMIDTEINLWEKGGPWVFKSGVFEKIGLFDTDFDPSWYEDDDLLLRMALAKIIFARAENAVSLHYDGVTRKGELKKRYGESFYNDNFNKFCRKWGMDDSARFILVYDAVFRENKVAYVQLKGDRGRATIADIKYGKDLN
jgi:GT2 family glycosyltransferase